LVQTTPFYSRWPVFLFTIHPSPEQKKKKELLFIQINLYRYQGSSTQKGEEE